MCVCVCTCERVYMGISDKRMYGLELGLNILIESCTIRSIERIDQNIHIHTNIYILYIWMSQFEFDVFCCVSFAEC